MIIMKNNIKVLSCSTPEHRPDSPSKDSGDSLCDSDAASPVPFLCTQDGTEGDVSIRCTQDEIRRKHQQAREKLLAKRLLPFTAKQQTVHPAFPIEKNVPVKKSSFQPRVASSNITNVNNNQLVISDRITIQPKPNSVDLKMLIERKRQEALMKLRRKQPQNKIS